MEMSRKHKYPEKSRVWRREENIGKLSKRVIKQKPDPTVEVEWRRYQIRGEKTGMGERICRGTTTTRPTMEDDEWR